MGMGADAGADACHGHAHAGMSPMPTAVHGLMGSMHMPSISSMPTWSFNELAWPWGVHAGMGMGADAGYGHGS